MRISASLFLLFILFASTTSLADSSALDEAENRLRICEEQWCLAVARPPTPWPSPLKTHMVTVEEHPAVVLKIPAGFNRIRSTDYFLMFIFNHRKALILEEFSQDAFPDLREHTKSSRMTMADAARATFTKTTKDKAPERPDDRNFWNWAMLLKMAFFEHGVPVHSSRKGSLIAYYFSTKRKNGNIINEALIINEKSPDYLLKLKSTHMTFAEFKAIIGSIVEKRVVKP